MKKIVLVFSLLACIYTDCRFIDHPMADDDKSRRCRFVFQRCNPVDPCENAVFSLQELLIIENEGLYLETSVPYSRVLSLSFHGKSADYFFSPQLLAGQQYQSAGPYIIFIPVPPESDFWPAFNAAAAQYILLWSGELEYRCNDELPGELK